MLIINADDFGLSHAANMGVMESFRQGFCSSCTIMPNMPGFSEACELAHSERLHHHIGLHLTLTQGKPLTNSIKACPRFCNKQGLFCLTRQQRLFTLNQYEAQAVTEEILEQIRVCREQGIPITHIDSHSHVHEEWGIVSRVMRVAAENDIPFVRLCKNYGQGVSAAKRLYRTLVNMRLARSGLCATRHFGHPDEYRRYRRAQPHARQDNMRWEVMIHPSVDDQQQLVDTWLECLLHPVIERIPDYPQAVSYTGHRYLRACA